MNEITPATPISGLLYSQIGYELRTPLRALWRDTNRAALPENAVFTLKSALNGEVVLSQPLSYWGECWHSHWWVADFSSLTLPGEYILTIETGAQPAVDTQPFRVAEHLLWDATIRTVALDQFEARARLARFGKGWKDCGAEWREVCSHASALIGLIDLLNLGYEWLGPEDSMRLAQQIIHGCDYIVSCQERAAALGWPEGAIVHELPDHPVLITQDLGQSVVALANASRNIYEIDSVRGQDYLNRAAKAYEFLTRQHRPSTLSNFSSLAHGAPAGYQPASWMTGDLLMMVWGGLALAQAGKPEYMDEAVRRTREILRRQVQKEAPEGGLYGHFFTFEDCAFTEKAFLHHHVGYDTGILFNHYIVPLIALCRQLPNHADSVLWRKAVHDFAYGYLLPACRANPFNLLPEGYFSGQGLLTFCGPWHGFNVCYGYTAALAAQLESFFGDRQFREIAAGNLQWIAGLNAGFTNQSFEGSVLWRDEIPSGEAIPYSHIDGIGLRSVKSWSGIRGSIGNGLCTNRQFHLEVEPTLENDGPWRYADEDWVPHAGGWVSGLVHLRQTMRYSE